MKLAFQLLRTDVCVLVIQSCPTLCDPMDCEHQAPLSVGILKQDYWSGLPFPSPEDCPDSRIKPGFSALEADSLLSELHTGKIPHARGCSQKKKKKKGIVKIQRELR